MREIGPYVPVLTASGREAEPSAGPRKTEATYSWLTTSSSSEDDAVSSRSRAITTGISSGVCHTVRRQGPRRPFLADSPDQTTRGARIPAGEVDGSATQRSTVGTADGGQSPTSWETQPFPRSAQPLVSLP